MPSRFSAIIIPFAAVFLPAAFQNTSVNATSIAQTTVRQLATEAGFIFQGRVTAAQPGQSKAGPVTCFAFQVEEVLKGNDKIGSVRLCFLGGKGRDYDLWIAEMVVPRVGERGIYFVESLSRTQVHPLLGWSQGHFLIRRPKQGLDTVTTVHGRRVVE